MYYISISKNFDIDQMEEFVAPAGLELKHNDISAGKFILLKEEGTLKGMIGLEPCGEYGLLRSFLFMSEAQSQVPALFETIVALAKEKGMKKIYLVSNKYQAYGFFEALQFERVDSKKIPNLLINLQSVEKMWTMKDVYLMERAL